MIGCSSNNDNNIISLVENRLLQIAMHYQSLSSAYFAVAYIHLVNMCITFVLGGGGPDMSQNVSNHLCTKNGVFRHVHCTIFYTKKDH